MYVMLTLCKKCYLTLLEHNYLREGSAQANAIFTESASCPPEKKNEVQQLLSGWILRDVTTGSRALMDRIAPQTEDCLESRVPAKKRLECRLSVGSRTRDFPPARTEKSPFRGFQQVQIMWN